MGKHSSGHDVRCEVVRSRIEDWLASRNIRQTLDTRLYEQRRFAKRAVELGRQHKLRVWTDGAVKTAEESALQSLQYLLKERSTVTRGTKHTGSNDSWILDLWELTLASYTQPVSLAKIEEDDTPLVGEVVDDGVGVEPFATGNGAGALAVSVPKGTAMKLFEAFILRDDESFVELAREIEKLETA